MNLALNASQHRSSDRRASQRDDSNEENGWQKSLRRNSISKTIMQ